MPFGIDLPGIGDITNAVKSFVNDYILKPLLGWLADLYDMIWEGFWSGLTALSHMPRFIAKVASLFIHGDVYVASWLLKGFLQWIEALGNLLEDFLVEHWDD